MGWPVYTERFLRTDAASTWAVFTVPAGKRAVVRTITMVNGHSASVTFLVRVSLTRLAWTVVPANSTVYINGMTVAVYGGETIDAIIDGAGSSLIVGGFLFDDPNKAKEPAFELYELDRATPLPSDAA